MIKVKKLGLLIPRNTGGAKRVFRYEIPLLKRIWANHLDLDAKIEIEPIPEWAGDDIRFGYVSSAQDEYNRLSIEYATHGKHNSPLFERVYTNFQDFKQDFDLAMERDQVEEDVEVPVAEKVQTQHAPENEASAGGSELERIRGVGTDLAIKLIKAGMSKIKHVALAELEELEAIDGVGIASATKIHNEATKLLNLGATQTGEMV